MFDFGRRVLTSRLGGRIAARQPARVDLPLVGWRLEIGANGRLARDGVDLADLLERFGSPLHVVDAVAVERNVARALGARDGPGGVDVFYSYKTNPVPGVLTMLHAGGIGAEVISAYELWLAQSLGVPGDRIIYNGPAKTYDSVCRAVDSQVLLVNANSEGDYRQIVRAAREVARVARVGFRVALPTTWGGQFGLDAAAPVVEAIIRDAILEPAVEPIGLHVHRGITIRTRADLEGYLAAVLSYVDDLERRTGWSPSILDLGGSLSSPTVDSIPRWQFRLNRALATDVMAPDPSAAIEIGEAHALVRSTVAGHFAARQADPPRVVVEPGRALTGNTQMLLTTVHDVKRDRLTPHAVLDAGIGIAEPVQGEFHQLFSVTAPNAPADESYRLVGPICTPADVLYNNWRLPALEPGHVLAIMDTGAYFVPFSTSFSFPRPAIVLQAGAAVSVLRERETFADMIKNDRTTPANLIADHG